jgi:hypothetical protein
MAKRKKPLHGRRRTKREALQRNRYGKEWADLSDREKWYERHKTSSRKRPVNATIDMPRTPPCLGNWENDTCQICGQTYESFDSGVNWDQGIQLMKQAADEEQIYGQGFRSRGPVLYAMAVIKRRAFYMRHEIGCCLPVAVNQLEFGPDWQFWPLPPIVWYLSQYGATDGRSAKNIEQADEIRDGIMEAVRNGATTLKQLQSYKDSIRNLEKKYHRRDWWRKMIKEEKGVFYTTPMEPTGPEDEEFVFPF